MQAVLDDEPDHDPDEPDARCMVIERGLDNKRYLDFRSGSAKLVEGDEVVSGLGDSVVSNFGVDDVNEFVVDLEGVNFGLSLLSNNIVSSDVLFTLNTLGGPGGAVDFLELDGWVGDESVSGSLLNSVIPDSGLGGASVESWLLLLPCLLDCVLVCLADCLVDCVFGRLPVCLVAC